MIIFFIIVIVFIPIGLYLFINLLKVIRPQTKTIDGLFLVGYLFLILLFGFGLADHSNEYNVAIDPVDQCYTPFAGKHVFSLYMYFAYFNISLLVLWYWERKLPPLLIVFFSIGLFVGTIINVFVLIQVIGHDTSSLGYGCQEGILLLGVPLIAAMAAIYQIVKIIRNEMNTSITRHFKNPFLERCNQFLSQRYSVAVWALIFMLPVFIIITLILILFGQDANSLVKVFTDTTTWTFSQKMHPPILDHEGHYLCTVAAKGNPKIVKPIRLGKRHGNTIIVNRQLQIANAFEELIADYTPILHRFIRKNYDKYGYNLSLKITSKMGSNITYVLMKPLEWLFLICLYLGCQNPELKIQRQYS